MKTLVTAILAYDVYTWGGRYALALASAVMGGCTVIVLGSVRGGRR